MDMFWFILVVILYISSVGFLGVKGFKQTKNSTDYMVGGRNIHPFVMALSYGAAFISTSAIVGFSGAASFYGLSLLWLPFCNIFVGIFLAFLVFGKRTRRIGLNLNAHTFPELMGKRLDSRFIQAFAGIVIFLFMPLYAAAVLIGASRIIEGLIGIPYIYSVVIFSVLVAVYVIMGGIKGMMYTDALQGSLMFAGMLILLGVIIHKTGGFTAAHQALTNLQSLVPEALSNKGLAGWTVMPERGSELWWFAFSSLILGVGIGALAQPQLAVRYMTVKSDRELNRAVLIGGVFILITVGTPYIVGALSNVYFYQQTGQVSFVAAGGNPDMVMPMLIKSALPSWFQYLFMLVVLSAAISTMSSQFHTVGTSIGRDFYSHLFGHKEDGMKGEMLVTRIGIVVSILFTVLLGLVLEPGIVARATAIFFGLMASSFLIPYTAAIFWKRLTKAGAIAGIVSGFTVEIFMFLFTHLKEASVFGVCRFLFGSDTLFNGALNFVDPQVFALPVSLIFTIGVTLLTKVQNKERIEKSFQGIK